MSTTVHRPVAVFNASLTIAASACAGGPRPPAPRTQSADDVQLLRRVAPYGYRIPPETGDGSATAPAGDVGFDVARLERMTEAIRRDGELRTVTIEFHRDTLHDIRSAGKSVTSALAGIALDAGTLDAGALPALDSPLIRLFPEHAAGTTEAARRITLRHALTMSAGLEWNEWDVPYTDSSNHAERMSASADPAGFVLRRLAAAEPGSAWYYNSGLPALVGVAIARATGTSLGRYAREALFEPLGITQVEWTGPAAWRGVPELRRDGSPGWGDVANPAGSLWLRPRDLAKFGALYLNQGRWNGRQVIVVHLAGRYNEPDAGWMPERLLLEQIFHLDFVVAGDTEYEYHDLRGVGQGVALLRSRAIRTGQQLPNGTVEPPRRTNHLRVFVKRGGRWLITSHLIGDERTPGEPR